MKPEPITTGHDTLILDSCCLLNLYASGQMGPILTTLAEQVKVAAYVQEVEALRVYAVSKQASPTARELVKLELFIEAGLLQIVSLENKAEKNLFASLAGQRLDDGEAISLALAIERGWAIATDDKRAQRICERDYSTVGVVSTPQLLKHWADVAHPSASLLAQTLASIEARANYLVGRRDPLYAWWQAKR